MRSKLPLMINPEEGQGAKKLKSCELAGGETETKPLISGLLIKSCIPIQEPKEKPITQQALELGVFACRKSKADAASANSPNPSSNSPSLFPTPLKLNLKQVNPRLKKQ